jgi:orotate phosphoribosyltransferase
MRELITQHGANVAGLGVIVDRREVGVEIDVPVASLVNVEVQTFDQDDCPLCRDEVPLAAPGSRHVA